MLDLLKIRKKTGRHKALSSGVEIAAPVSETLPKPAPSAVKEPAAARRKPQADARRKPEKSAPAESPPPSGAMVIVNPEPSPSLKSADVKIWAPPAPTARPVEPLPEAIPAEPPPSRAELRQTKASAAIVASSTPALPAVMPAAPGSPQALQVSDDALNRHLLCRVHQETFAVPISDILEILRERSLTPLPLTAPALAGILSLRGRMVPVVDAALRLGFEPFPSDENCRIVVFEIAGEWIGLRVAAVGQVSLIDPDAVQHSAAALGDTRSEITSGVLRISDQFVTVPVLQQLLDVTGA